MLKKYPFHRGVSGKYAVIEVYKAKLANDEREMLRDRD